jgi:hypothetical protein
VLVTVLFDAPLTKRMAAPEVLVFLTVRESGK